MAVADDFSDWSVTRTKAEMFNDRPTEWFTHAPRAAWECKNDQQKDTFIVVHPKTGDRAGAPLYVVLHSAGHDVHSCLDCTRTVGNHDIYRSPDDFYALYVDCRAHQPTDWWWGDKKETAPGQLTPVEKRVIDTVLWTIQKYNIDDNRVYLSGNSMGGSGTLGLGLRHGNIFAAIKANVPAGVHHAADRMYFPPASIPADVVIADPPVCLDYSAYNDGWSDGHDLFFNAMKTRKYSLIAYWGGFGHANNHKSIERVNDLINTFDWLSIRKDQAYPVFTNASTDDVSPWPERQKGNAPGQINAWFRWKNISDTNSQLKLQISLTDMKESPNGIFQVPASAKADVSFRRLQKFSVKPGDTVDWLFKSAGSGSASGSVKADAEGLITIPQLNITAAPAEITLIKR